MNFWERLEAALDENRISEAELSRLLNINQSTVTGWKTRDAIPRADIAVKAAEILNTSVEYLIKGSFIDTKTLKKNFLVPILNQELSAGKGSALPDNDEIKGLVALPSYLKEYGENIACLFVHGDSMEPTLKNGDMVVCTSLGWDNGEGLYAIRLNGNGYIKRIQVGTNKIIIRSDNPQYQPIEEPAESENFSVIGKVLLIIKKA